MGYADLYEHCKALRPKVRRNLLKAKVLEIAKVSTVKTVMTSLDTSVCRGFYVSPRNTGHSLVQRYGCHVIVLARSMDKRMERFVFIKELMHVFDDPQESTDNPKDFEATLSDLTIVSPTTMSPQLRSEHAAIWMALGVICPEPVRLELLQSRSAGTTNDEAISDMLGLPTGYVPHLFGEGYDTSMNAILGSAFFQAA